MGKIYKFIRHLFIRLNSVKAFYKLGQLYYHFSIRLFIYIVKLFPEIKSIYLRNSFAMNDWIPWESDIDLTIIIKNLTMAEEIKFLNMFWKVHKALRIPFPFIKHIHMFNLKEFSCDILYNKPILSYLINNLKLAYGNDYRKTLNYDPNDGAAFWLRRWPDFMRWLYQDNFNGKTYMRNYYRFFDAILFFSENNHIDAKGFRDILSNVRPLNFYLKNPEEFVLKGLYYSLNIVNGIYKRLNIDRQTDTNFQHLSMGEEISTAFLGKTKLFIEFLSPYIKNIKSIFVDSGSIQDNRPRVWIILKNDIDEKNFIKLFQLIRREANHICGNDIFPCIFMEDALYYFLTTHRFWIFESFHLSKHARVVFGENMLNKLRYPDDGRIIRMTQNAIVLYIARLMITAENQNINQYSEHFFSSISYKLLLERNIIVTTVRELVNIHNRFYHNEVSNLLIKLINKESIEIAKIYSLLKRILDDLLDKYCTKYG